MRYEIFEKEAESWGGAKIAVAHNRGDDAETVLFHLIRGSGLSGMRGILPVRGNVIRPLLHTGREEILSYLEEKNSLIVWMQQTVMSITPETASGRRSCQD